MGGQPLLSKKHLHIFDDLFWFLSPFWDQKYFVGENYSANFVNSFRIKQFFRIIKEKQDTSTLYSQVKQKCGIGFHAQTHTHIHCQELHQDLFVTQDSVKMCEYLFQSIMLGGNT